jgi:putative acetyltransferase
MVFSILCGATLRDEPSTIIVAVEKMRRSGHIRRAQSAERPGLLALWERSVRATHTFLSEADIAFSRPLTAEILGDAALELWVLTDETDAPVGFIGLAGHSIESLFLEPSIRRQGGGGRLVAHAQELRGTVLTVDVNEQNVDACRFYHALGFGEVARSSHDGTGRPYPILHLRREPPGNIWARVGYLFRKLRRARVVTHSRRIR